MTFGLKNAPGTFQSETDVVLAPLYRKYTLVYLEDIVIFSKSLAEHISHVGNVLQQLTDTDVT